tara:strand:+ start:139 stop:282 length:144 start_codon:yes stop_codon:yes gene_type:complete
MAEYDAAGSIILKDLFGSLSNGWVRTTGNPTFFKGEYRQESVCGIFG